MCPTLTEVPLATFCTRGPFLRLGFLSLSLWALGGPPSAAAEGYALSKIALSGETAPDSGGATYQPTNLFPTAHPNSAREMFRSTRS